MVFLTPSGFGFGYLPLTKLSPIEVMVMVYTLGSGNDEWRGIGRFVYAGECDINQRLGVFVNGALHCVDNGKEIFVFYLAKEFFFVQPPPPASPQGGYRKADKIGVLGGFLFQRYSDSDDAPASHDIWLYKKKNGNNFKMEQEDWTREFKLPAEELLEFTKSGGILTYSSNNLNLYDPKTSTSKTLAFFREGFRRVFPHKNTLLSLEELGEEDTEIMKSGYIT